MTKVSQSTFSYPCPKVPPGFAQQAASKKGLKGDSELLLLDFHRMRAFSADMQR